MTDGIYTCDNVRLTVRNREKLTKVADENFKDDLEILAGWETDLYKLFEVDPTEMITLDFPTEQFIEKTRNMAPDSDEFMAKFCETMSGLMSAELKRRNIDINKLHYGVEKEQGIEYEYSHIASKEYNSLLECTKEFWYRVTCVVPYSQIHKDTFFVPNNRLHEFFDKNIYKCYNGNNRRIVDIGRITQEEAYQELERIKKTIKENQKRKFRA